MSWEDVTKLRISEQKYKQIPIYLLKIMHRKSHFQYAIIKTNASPEGAICLFSRTEVSSTQSVRVTKSDDPKGQRLRSKTEQEKSSTGKLELVHLACPKSSTQSVRVTTFRVNN